MAESPRFPDTAQDAHAAPGESPATPSPRGSSTIGKILAIGAGIAILVLIVVLHLTGTLGPGLNPGLN